MPTSPAGPIDSDVLFVGEAPGEQEDFLGCPFIGASGSLLAGLIANAGLDDRKIPRDPLNMRAWWQFGKFRITNVFQSRPPNNNLEAWLVPKSKAATGLPHISSGKYLPPELLPNLDRLRAEVEAMPNLNLIVALGRVASWALIKDSGITKVRGYIYPCTLVPGRKVLPTFHPAAVLRNYELHIQVLADLMKIPAERKTRAITVLQRSILIDPDLNDIEDFARTLTPDTILSFDIETAHNQITSIGFAISPVYAIVVPFVAAGNNYWTTVEEELRAWQLVRKILGHPCPKLAQNGLYDIQWLWRKMGIPVRNFLHDTMLLHHSLQPELPKGLAWLGSVHASSVGNWKALRRPHQTEDKRTD